MSVSGYSAQPADPNSSATSVTEPSMEDILASIRRIIAADHSVAIGRNGVADLTQPKPPAPDGLPSAEAAEAGIDEDRGGADKPPSSGHPDPQGIPGTAAADVQHLAEAASHLPPRPDLTYEAETIEHGAAHEEIELPPVGAPGGRLYDLQLDDLVGAPEDPDALLSASVGASISSSFEALAESVLFRDPETLERIARDALRPMLKTWLDENLPGMVERLVRAEIERVARGGRSRN